MSGETEVLKAANKIVTDFGAHKPKEYFSNFAEDASFIFYTHSARLNSKAEYEILWQSWERNDGFKVHSCSSSNQRVQIFGDVAVFTHDVETSVELLGETNAIFERETIVFKHVGNSWIAVHEHLSPKN